jgi:hypothetical protein
MVNYILQHVAVAQQPVDLQSALSFTHFSAAQQDAVAAASVFLSYLQQPCNLS